MLYEACKEINNAFIIPNQIEQGEYVIQQGEMNCRNSYYKKGQYVLIKGSIFNDGIYRIEDVQTNILSFVITNADYPKWIKPTGAVNAYKIGDKVTHESQRYISNINANVYLPGSDERWWAKVVDDIDEHHIEDEEFNGTIYGLAIPRDFIELVQQVAVFQLKQGSPSLNVSERFGIDSRVKAVGKNGAVLTWREVFASGLNRYRKNPALSDVKV